MLVITNNARLDKKRGERNDTHSNYLVSFTSVKVLDLTALFTIPQEKNN